MFRIALFFRLNLAMVLMSMSALFGSTSPVILVTGGAGYIGSHTCKALKEAGFTPVTYDSLALGAKEAVQWGPLIVGDLLDTGVLDQAFTKYKPCAVIHFAGLRNVRDSVKDPSSYYQHNVTGSINLLNAMLKHQVKQIIFSSSCTVYGDCLISPIPEAYPKAPSNPYAKSKLVVESIIQDYAHAYQFKYMILRYFNAAGIDNKAGLKRAENSCGFLIPRALISQLHKDKTLEVFGSDYPTPDGTCIRDYIHVKDLASAHVRALQHLQKGKESNELNLGTGKGYSVLEIIRMIEKVTGKPVAYELKQRKEGDASEAVAEVKKAKEVIGFEASFSDLQTIIESEWISQKDTR